MPKSLTHWFTYLFLSNPTDKKENLHWLSKVLLMCGVEYCIVSLKSENLLGAAILCFYYLSLYHSICYGIWHIEDGQTYLLREWDNKLIGWLSHLIITKDNQSMSFEEKNKTTTNKSNMYIIYWSCLASPEWGIGTVWKQDKQDGTHIHSS